MGDGKVQLVAGKQPHGPHALVENFLSHQHASDVGVYDDRVSVNEEKPEGEEESDGE